MAPDLLLDTFPAGVFELTHCGGRTYTAICQYLQEQHSGPGTL